MNRETAKKIIDLEIKQNQINLERYALQKESDLKTWEELRMDAIQVLMGSTNEKK